MNEKLIILLAGVDEDDVFLLNESFHLARWHAQFHFVENGNALMLYLEGSGPYANRVLHPFPALVVMDMEMPIQSGFEILAWTRTQENLRQLPMVMLSSSFHGPHIESAYELGTNSYLVKIQQFRSLLERMKMLECWAAHHPGNGLPSEIRQNV